jgi:hypothetical protein
MTMIKPKLNKSKELINNDDNDELRKLPVSNRFTARTLFGGMRSADGANRVVGVKNAGH